MRRHGEFGIACQLQFPATHRTIRDREASQFNIVVGGDSHRQQRFNAQTTALELRAIRGEANRTLAYLFGQRLVRRSPRFA